jgi:type IV secretion system protein VirB11
MAMTVERSTERTRREHKLQRELGPKLCRLMSEPDVREVMVNPDGAVFVDRAAAGLSNTGLRACPMQLKAALGTMAALLDTVITKEQPILQGELPLFGGRIEGLRAPVVEGPSFSFRKKASQIFTLAEYEESGRITGLQKSLLENAVAERRNILVVGGTGTGKTTFINALLRHLEAESPQDRIVVIEDTRELQCALANQVALRAVEGTVSMNGLLRSTLRLRPDRIIVGEVRGPEALTLLKAWNTGHPGGFSSLHANDTEAALRRIEMLVQEACGQRLPELIAEAVDLIVHLERGAKVEGLLRVHGYEHGRYETATLEGEQ